MNRTNYHRLTPVEWSVFQPLVKNHNKCVPFDWFYKNVVGVENMDNLAVWIVRIRRKVGRDKIVTIRKRGYKYIG